MRFWLGMILDLVRILQLMSLGDGSWLVKMCIGGR